MDPKPYWHEYHCVECGYDWEAISTLTGPHLDRCPQCGKQRTFNQATDDTQRLLAAHQRLLALVANQSYTSVADGALNVALFADEPIRIDCNASSQELR